MNDPKKPRTPETDQSEEKAAKIVAELEEATRRLEGVIDRSPLDTTDEPAVGDDFDNVDR